MFDKKKIYQKVPIVDIKQKLDNNLSTKNTTV